MKKRLFASFLGIIFVLQILIQPPLVHADALGSKNCASTAIDTAIGCIEILGPGGQNAFLGLILRWSIGIGSGIAFLLILYSGFMIMSSAGDPTRLKAGQELLTSAISGIILLIFSLFILNFIGVNVLGIFT